MTRAGIHSTDEVDSSEMMGLRGPVALSLVAGLLVYMLAGVLMARRGVVDSLIQVGIAVAVATAVLVTFRARGARLPTWACAVAAVIVVATGVVAGATGGAEPDLRTVNWIGTGWVVSQTYTAARGRMGWAVASVLGGIGAWAAVVVALGGDPGPGLAGHLGRLPVLLMSIVFGLVIERRARDIAALRTRGRQKTEEQAAAAAGMLARDERLRWVREVARPILGPIARGDRFGAAERLDAAVLEAHIRDTIRAPSLTGGELDAVVAGARRRGVLVTLLDDGGLVDLDLTAARRMREITAERIEAATAPGRVVVRVLPPGRDEVVSFAGDASPGRRSYAAADLTAGTPPD